MSDTPSKAKHSRKKNKKKKEENEPESEPESEPEPEPTSSSKDENTADEIDFRKLVTSMLSDAKKQQKLSQKLLKRHSASRTRQMRKTPRRPLRCCRSENSETLST